MSLDINTFAEEVHANACEKGFHNERIDIWIRSTTANMHGEISEFWEAFRKKELDAPCDKECGITCGQEELADIIIRALDSMKRLGYNPEDCLRAKAKYNSTREYMHGKIA